MNERIKELAKQSGGEFWQRIESDGVLNKEAYITFDPSESLEKFAKLIVRECASVIEKNHPDFTCKEDADNLYRKAGRMDAIDEILQHFGVE